MVKPCGQISSAKYAKISKYAFDVTSRQNICTNIFFRNSETMQVAKPYGQISANILLIKKYNVRQPNMLRRYVKHFYATVIRWIPLHLIIHPFLKVKD